LEALRTAERVHGWSAIPVIAGGCISATARHAARCVGGMGVAIGAAGVLLLLSVPDLNPSSSGSAARTASARTGPVAVGPTRRGYRGRIEALLERSRDGTVLIGADGRLIYVSPSTAQILGYAAEHLIDNNIFSLIHPDDVQGTSELFGHILSEPGRTESGTFRFRHADGSWRSMEGTGTNHLELPGVDAVVAHFWEVDQPRPGLQAFDIVEDQFRVLIENAVHITAIVEPAGTIRYVSPAVERMLGYPPESLKGVHISNFIHAQDVPAAMAALESRIRHPGPGQLIEFRVRHRDGSWRVLEAIATNRLDDPVIAGVVIDARDVTERKWSAERLQHSLEALLAIHDVGRRLGSSLEHEAIGAALLDGAQRVVPIDAATLLLRKTRGHLSPAQTFGPKPLCDAARRSSSARSARQQVLLTGAPQFFRLAVSDSDGAPLDAWALPLRLQERVIGVLEVYGASLADGSGNAELGILADQAASALERARLYREAAERERRLEDLVRRLLLAQEEERRRVAYEVHDGLAQIAAAAQQHLEAFASRYRSASSERRDELGQALTLARATVREARRVIAGLRPTVLDDFGLAPAIAFELQGLRGEGWQVEYTDGLGPLRLEPTLETALFRVTQEALANVRKHSHSNRVAVTLERHLQTVRLEIRDWGRGFRPSVAQARSGPSERVGLAGIQERIALLRGRCSIRSRPGAGVRITVEVPLRERKGKTS
jgi:PAS domain S-box-containing protein